MSWNIKTPGDYINGPLTVVGAVTLNSTLSIGGETRIRSGNQLRVYRSDNAIYSSIEDAGSGVGLVLNNLNGDGFRLRITGNNVYNVAGDGTYTQTWLNGAGSDWMRLNATGLGIGVSPAFKLSVAGVSQFYADSDGIYASGNSSPDLYTIGVNYYNAAGTEGVKVSARPSWKIEHKNSSDALAYLDIGFRAASAAASAFTSRFKIDGSGNVGIGVTPSAWGSGFKALEFANSSFFVNALVAGNPNVAANFFYNASAQPIYKSNGFASAYSQYNGAHSWATAPSGTAGNVITFNTAMTLNASGTLLVGLTTNTGTYSTPLVLSSNAGTVGWSNGPTAANPSNFYISGTGGNGVYLNGVAATSWTAISDARFKDIIEPINDAVAKVGSLRSVIGKFKTDAEGVRRSFLIAQDVQAVLPEAVDASNPDRLGVAYTEVIPLLVAAIKELTARVQTLETR